MMRSLFICLFLCLGFATHAQAATDDVRVSQFINTDFTPPTTPTALVATTTTFDRIFLTWGASTDNYLLGGYQVFRDAVQIATTSLTTYTDIGLAASSTHTYHVIAFDHAFNFSSSSNFATATTTDRPPEDPESLPSPTRTEVQLRNISIEPKITSAEISWTTNRATRYELRWGRTQSYELGFVAGQSYYHDHVTLIDSLEPDTIYEYELVSFDRGGNARVLSQGRFRTLTQPDVVAPPNVADLRARTRGDDVELSWRNPTYDFAYVRIVRNPFFYPRDPNDGYIVYQGSLESFSDRGALRDLHEVFYTAFVLDPSGNRSSGATTRAIRFNGDIVAPQFTTEPVGDFDLATGTATFSIDDILIFQAGETIRSVSGSFLVDTTESFTIHAPYELFPEHLKTIQVTLFHPVDTTNSQSFLLRINNDKTGYEATVSQLGYIGTIPMRLVMYDFFTREMSQAEGTLISKVIEPEIALVTNVVSQWQSYIWWSLLLLLLLLILWWFIILRRKTEDKTSVRLP